MIGRKRQRDGASSGNTHLPPRGQPRLPWLVLLKEVERKHGRLRERTHTWHPLYALLAVPFSMDRVGGFILFYKAIGIMLEGHLESFLTIYLFLFYQNVSLCCTCRAVCLRCECLRSAVREFPRKPGKGLRLHRAGPTIHCM